MKSLIANETTGITVIINTAIMVKSKMFNCLYCSYMPNVWSLVGLTFTGEVSVN